MSGINVLNVTQIMESPSWAALLIVFGVLCLWIFIALIVASFQFEKIMPVIIGCILLVISLISFRIGIQYLGTVPTGKYKYEVTIDKDVSFTELNSKYNIIEQRGNIYILEDK